MAGNTLCAGNIVDGDEAIPLLDSQRLVMRDTCPFMLYLRVEGVHVDMQYNAPSK